MKSTIYHILVAVLGLQLMGCGYFSDDPPQNQVFDIKDMRSQCDLDTEEFNRIFSEDVSLQIKCLEENFNQFVRYVRRDRADQVNEAELTTFVNRFFSLNRDHFLRGLRFLFEINMLLLNDRNESISTENIRPLFQIILNTNKKAVLLTKVLEKTNEKTYLKHKEELLRLFSELTNSILEIANSGNGQQLSSSKINIKEFIKGLNEKFPELEVDEETADSFLFLKKLFLGGNKFEINNAEVKQLLSKSPQIFEIALDLFYLTEETYKATFGEEQNIYTHYQTLIQKMRGLLYPLNDHTMLFKVDDFLIALNSIGLLKKSGDILDSLRTTSNLKILAESFKVNVLGTNPQIFTFKDLKASFSFLEVSTLSIPHYLTIKEKFELLSKASIPEKNQLIQELERELKTLSDKIIHLIAKNTDIPEQQDLLTFVQDINRLTDEEYSLPAEIIDGLFSLKTLFMGGHKNILTKDQLIDFIKKLPKMSSHMLNVAYIKDEELHTGTQKSEFFIKRLGSILSFIHKPSIDEVVFTRDELIHLADYFSKGKEFNIHSYLPSIDAIKVKVLKGTKHQYTTNQIAQFLQIILGGFETSYYFDLSYRNLSWLLKRRSPITYVPSVSLEEFSIFSKQREKELRKIFVHQVKTFRYFRGSNGVAYYGHLIKRNQKGFTEAALVNYIFTILQNSYGKLNERGELVADYKILEGMLLDFNAVLQELGLWTYNFKNFVRNVLLLSDLFQSTSNGTMQLELDETSEFGVLVLQTMTLSNEMLDGLKEIEDSGRAQRESINCKYTLDENNSPAFPIPCHRHFFFKVFFEELNHKKDFPMFYQFYKESTEEELKSFLSDIEGFARDFNDPKVPMAKRDYGLVIGALLNIESTFIRFDQNNDNSLDNEELDQAFEIYRDAIIAVAELDETQHKYAKSIFLYMVKYQQIPTKWQVVNFHYNPFADTEVSAKRIHIGTLLYYLVKK